MIRGIFFDVDYTLYSHKQNKIPDSTVYAIQKLKENGIKVFLATGRHLQELKQIDMRNLSFDGYITLSGQLCLDDHFQKIWSNPIDEYDVKILLKEFEKKEVPILFVEEDRLYMNMHTNSVKKALEMINLTLPPVMPYSGNSIYQMTLFEDRKKILEVIHDTKYCHCTGWNEFGSDIISLSGGKAIGIQKVLGRYGLSQKEIMAFGDGENDFDMLSLAQIGVCMGNGNHALKEIADHVTKDIDEDGIYHALMYYGLL